MMATAQPQPPQPISLRPRIEAKSQLSSSFGISSELPGIVTDYHFAIQSACGRLWLDRLENPQYLTELERWCRLDLALLKAKPYGFQYEHDGELSYYSIGAFSYLRSLYEKEGALLEALEVAEEESQFNPNEKQLEQLRERVRAEAED
jgi:hypothetical protein